MESIVESTASWRASLKTEVKRTISGGLNSIESLEGSGNLYRIDRVLAACDALEAFSTGKREPDPVVEEKSLQQLRLLLGVSSLPITTESGSSYDLLSLKTLQGNSGAKKALIELIENIRALVSARLNSAKQILLGEKQISCHNSEIAARLRERYNHKQLLELVELAVDRGVFDLVVDSTGLVKTSLADENWDMSARQWITDTVRCGDLERATAPAAWRKAMLMVTRFYCRPTEEEAFRRCIANPDLYRTGPVTEGVAHIFIPGTLDRDPKWSNNKRLESHGLALRALCQTARAGLVYNQPWGFTSEDLEGNTLHNLGRTIANLANYLKAINTSTTSDGVETYDFAAPSAGCWEEMPFPGGLTWDTEAIRSGFEALDQLLSEDAVGDRLSRLRRMVKNQAVWLADRNKLLKVIEAARMKVIERVCGPSPMEHPLRPADSSLAFISTSTIRLSDNHLTNVRLQFKVLEYLEENLLRENGMIRYQPFDLANGRKSPDSYLSLNYWLVPEMRALLATGSTETAVGRYGSEDCNTVDGLIARAALSKPDTEAEWPWVSVLAEGYGRQVALLIESIEHESRPANHDELALIVQGQAKATEMLNRAYGRVTGTGSNGNPLVKANGKICPDFAVPEAYEHLTNLTNRQETVTAPGAHTPLAWAQSSLFAASRQVLKNLASLESSHYVRF